METTTQQIKDLKNPIYIFFKSIITFIVLILIFVSPFFVYADDEQIEINTTAEIYYNNYRTSSLEQITLSNELLIDEPILPIYHTDCNYYLYSGYYGFYENVTRRVWWHAFDLYYQGLIHGANPGYQCTFFAQMWFYDVYGFNSTGNSTSGNGGDFAYNVYLNNTYYDEEGNLQHYFEISDHPETMGVLSINGISNIYGHAICIDEVDYKNNTITFSDGNVTNNGDVRIRVCMDLDDFYAQNPGYYTFVNPTQALLDLLNNQ